MRDKLGKKRYFFFFFSTKGRVFLPQLFFKFKIHCMYTILSLNRKSMVSWNRDYKIPKKLVTRFDQRITLFIRSFMTNIREIKSASFLYLSHLFEIEIFNSTLFLNPIISFRIITFLDLRFSNKETRSVPNLFPNIDPSIYIYTHMIKFYFGLDHQEKDDAQRSKFSREISQREKVFSP